MRIVSDSVRSFTFDIGDAVIYFSLVSPYIDCTPSTIGFIASPPLNLNLLTYSIEEYFYL